MSTTPPTPRSRRSAPPPPTGSTAPPPPSTAGTSGTRATEGPPDISVWGLKGSGKTTMFVALVRALRGGNLVPGYSVEQPNDLPPDSLEYRGTRDFFGLVNTFVQTGRLPPATSRGIANPFLLHVGYLDRHMDGTTGRFYKLSVMDAAGELSLDEGRNDYWDHMRQSAGILCVVDTLNDKTVEGYPQAVDILLRQLGLARTYRGGKLPHCVAVCVTKSDLQEPGIGAVDASNPDATDARSLLDRRMGRDTANLLLNAFHKDRIKVFATSAVGWYFDNNQQQLLPNFTAVSDSSATASESDRLIYPDEWYPYNTVYPLFWLFDQIERERIFKHRPWYLQRHTLNRRKKNQEILQEAVHSNQRPYMP